MNARAWEIEVGPLQGAAYKRLFTTQSPAVSVPSIKLPQNDGKMVQLNHKIWEIVE